MEDNREKTIENTEQINQQKNDTSEKIEEKSSTDAQKNSNEISGLTTQKGNIDIDIVGKVENQNTTIISPDFVEKLLANRRLEPEFNKYTIKKSEYKKHLEDINLGININKILEKSILLVCSYNEDIVIDAHNAILTEIQRDHDFEIKFLANSSLNESFDFPFFINTIRKFKRTVVVLDIRIKNLYDSIFKIGKQDLNQISTILNGQKVFILFSLTYQKDSGLIENLYQRQADEVKFPIWNIDFIIPLFKQKLREYAPRHEEFKKLLLYQQEKGLWDNSLAKKAFYFEVKNALRDPQHFVKRIEQNVEEARSEAEEKFKEIQRVFEEDELFEAVGLILSQFSKLNLGQLDAILEIYLKHLDEEMFEQDVNKMTDEDGKVMKDKSITLLHRWKKAKRRQRILFKKLHLESRIEEDDKRTVGFKNTFTKTKVQAYFNLEELFQLEELWTVFRNNNILFQKHIETNIIEGIVQLLSKLIQDFGHKISSDYLSEVYIKMLQLHLKTSSQASNIQELINNYRDKEYQSFLEKRLTLILTFFYEKEELRKTVHSFLRFLIKMDHFHLFIRLIDSLKYHEDFDELLWMKHMFNIGSPSSKENAFSYLLYWVSRTSSDTQVLERCTRIRQWLVSENEATTIKFIDTIAMTHASLQLYDITKRFPISNYVSWPKEYPLFLFSRANTDDKSELLSLCIQWLFNKQLSNYFRILCKDWGIIEKIEISKNRVVPFNVSYLRSEIIKHWFIFLAKKSGWNGKPKNLPTEMQQLLSLIKAHTSKKQIVALCKYLNFFRKANEDDFIVYQEKKDNAKEKAVYDKNNRQIKTAKLVNKVLEYLIKKLK